MDDELRASLEEKFAHERARAREKYEAQVAAAEEQLQASLDVIEADEQNAFANNDQEEG